MPAETLSAKEAARELGTDARTFRKFMRATTPKENQPGQGNRYAIPKNRMRRLKTAFDEWNKPKVKAEPPADEELDEELEEMMISEDEDFLADEIESDDEEPSDEELGEIEGEEDFDLTDVEEL